PISNNACASWRRSLLRALDRRLALRETPDVAHRCGLRACAAIGAGRPLPLSGDAAIDATLTAIMALGNQAAAQLRAIPDSAALRRHDRAFAAWHPAAARPRGPLVRRMAQLVERYRDQCGIDRLRLQMALAKAYATAAARVGPAFPQQEQVGLRANCQE